MRIREEIYKPALLILLAGVPCLLGNASERGFAFVVVSIASYALARAWLRKSGHALKAGLRGEKMRSERILDDVVKPVSHHLQANTRITPVLTGQLKEVTQQTERATLELGEKFSAIAGRARNRTKLTMDAIALLAEADKTLAQLAVPEGKKSGGAPKKSKNAHERTNGSVDPHALSRLDAVLKNLGDRLEAMKKESEAFAKDAGDIIVSMQFQDITRQRIEHVIEPLERFQQDSERLLRALTTAAEADRGRDHEILERLENIYTMESERDVMKKKLPALNRK